jgi:hypothetical protein
MAFSCTNWVKRDPELWGEIGSHIDVSEREVELAMRGSHTFALSMVIVAPRFSFHKVKKCLHKEKKRPMHIIFWVLLCMVALWHMDFFHWLQRIWRRLYYYHLAKSKAEETNLPLMVVGDPYGGPTNRVLGAFYGCGDVTVDVGGSKCPNTIKDDLTATLQKLPDRSHVIFVSVVLEYVENLKTCVTELERVSGGNLFVVQYPTFIACFSPKILFW